MMLRVFSNSLYVFQSQFGTFHLDLEFSSSSRGGGSDNVVSFCDLSISFQYCYGVFSPYIRDFLMTLCFLYLDLGYISACIFLSWFKGFFQVRDFTMMLWVFRSQFELSDNVIWFSHLSWSVFDDVMGFSISVSVFWWHNGFFSNQPEVFPMMQWFFHLILCTFSVNMDVSYPSLGAFLVDGDFLMMLRLYQAQYQSSNSIVGFSHLSLGVLSMMLCGFPPEREGFRSYFECFRWCYGFSYLTLHISSLNWNCFHLNLRLVSLGGDFLMLLVFPILVWVLFIFVSF